LNIINYPGRIKKKFLLIILLSAITIIASSGRSKIYFPLSLWVLYAIFLMEAEM